MESPNVIIFDSIQARDIWDIKSDFGLLYEADIVAIKQKDSYQLVKNRFTAQEALRILKLLEL